jgi:sulfate permease, SulP family
MVHALTLLVVLIAGASVAGRIPMAVLAAILLVVAWRMGEWSDIPGLLRQTRADVAVWLATFALTVFADLTVAVEVGMVLAALMFIRRIAVTTTVSKVTKEYLSEGRAHVLQDKPIPDYVAIYRIHGPFLFGATDKIQRVIDDLPRLPPVVVFRLRNMTALDATGLRALEDVADRVRASGRTAVFCGAREQPRAVMKHANFSEHVGAANLCPHVDAALARAAEIHSATTAT